MFIDAYAIRSAPVTAGEYMQFIAAGGYRRPEFWLSEGWDVKTAHGWTAPLYWQSAGDDWQAFTPNGLQSVAPDETVSHVSFFEADAYARWAGARLPTEAEWETFAVTQPVMGNLLEDARYHPAPPRVERQERSTQVFGTCGSGRAAVTSRIPAIAQHLARSANTTANSCPTSMFCAAARARPRPRTYARPRKN